MIETIKIKKMLAYDRPVLVPSGFGALRAA